MNYTPRCICVGWITSVLVSLAWAQVVPVAAQELPTEQQLDKKYTYEVRSTISDLSLGKTTYSKEQHENAVRSAAEYFVYYQALKTAHSNPRELQNRRTVLRTLVNGAAKSGDTTKDFRSAFAKQLIDCAQRVFKDDFMGNPQGHINTAILLPEIAVLKDESLGDFLIGLIQSEHDAVKHYAYKALQEHFKQFPINASQFNSNEVRHKEAARLQPLVEAVLQQREDLMFAPEEEKDGYRYVRLEAIKALGAAGAPGLAERVAGTGAGNHDGKLLSPSGYALLRILAQDSTTSEPPEEMVNIYLMQALWGIESHFLPLGPSVVPYAVLKAEADMRYAIPSPSFEERCEAAIALCNLNAKDFNRYNGDLVVALIGRFLVDFATEYRKDHDVFAVKGTKTPIPPKMFWKYAGERLRMGLDNLLKNNLPPNSTAVKNLAPIVQAANSTIFPQARDHRTMDDPTTVRNLVQQLPRPDVTVYRDALYFINLPRWP